MNEYAKSQVGAKVRAAACPAPTAYANGSALVFYNSTSYRDDLVWAAAWLYKATGEPVSEGGPVLAFSNARLLKLIAATWLYKASGEPVSVGRGLVWLSPMRGFLKF